MSDMSTVNEESMYVAASQALLRTGSLFTETEGFFAEIQDEESTKKQRRTFNVVIRLEDVQR